MNRNSLLNIANFFCQLFKVIIGITIIMITAVFIHSQFEPDFYSEWKVNKPEVDSIVFIKTETSTGQIPAHEEDLRFTDWKLASLYFNYLKFAGILFLIYLSISQFQKVLQSVRKLETFHQANVDAFKNIGYYCLLITAFSIFNYWEFGNHATTSFSVSLDILLVALIAFILAEIFKEGNNLMEENKFTV
ncbi:DUF2975 domain-containing protein [Antarcticibacterium flavum]|uniref:DUF2975 domain-containing protein n=1 Tax=Antarcticibacterium flavum TaxID=2058175 RepID=A0A5B7X3H7_9FLAO|nr:MULTISPECIES: DUF2975 domain-containing protein [Antarcticibacterium]MCM4160538.1 hypothetical protein [Antarcticibacterium sp. W02-3]QCY69800.1 DUF2975 domain-containing protein [Antarcticibacterium flavum]